MAQSPHTPPQKMPALIVSALGVVYGDIGTSPLYALRSCFNIGQYAVTPENVLGIISLFIWCLIIIVFLKYIYIVLKMDHQGEGGILALSKLVASRPAYRSIAILLGILGASLFFGDGVLTPAISVLSAMEGIAVTGSTRFAPYIVPFTLIVLTGLFAIQRFGSSEIGRFFGPLMALWFLCLFLLGISQIHKAPQILHAVNPYHALYFLLHHGPSGLLVMGGVILVVTGAEAMYADLGHFGRRPIQLSWTYCVFPALVCNYLGQGALLLQNPNSLVNPFYLMAPSWALSPLVIIATLATVIASQAIISGLYSITYHCILLNYFPRLNIKHTSEFFQGQIYVPSVTLWVYLLTVGSILYFGSSDKLALAYGLCVAGIMLITTVLISMRLWTETQRQWGKLALLILFFLIDSLFLSTSLMKFFEGAWYVLLISGIVFYCIQVWRQGSIAMEKQKIIIDLSIDHFVENHLKIYPQRITGTALFLCREPFKIPTTLAINLQHNKYLHEKIVFVALLSTHTPYQEESQRFDITELPHGIYQVIVRSGFMEKPHFHRLLSWLKQQGIIHHPHDISIFLSHGVPVRTTDPFLSGFAENVYFYLASVAQSAADFYQIPPQHVMEIGIRYKI